MYPQRSRIPDRWSDYSNFKGVIKECRILPCKTPLKEELFRTGTSQELLRENQNFTPDDLCEMVQENLQSNVEFVIDFTNTNRYYDSRDFEKRGIKYIKIECVGKQVPSQDVYKMFHMAVDKCLQHATPQGVIAVHCTHGLNRSGFLVCNYLMNKYDYTVEQSVEIFNDARGHDIERTEYIDKLRIDKYPAPINNTFEFEERPIETITTDSIASLVREQHTRSHKPKRERQKSSHRSPKKSRTTAKQDSSREHRPHHGYPLPFDHQPYNVPYRHDSYHYPGEHSPYSREAYSDYPHERYPHHSRYSEGDYYDTAYYQPRHKRPHDSHPVPKHEYEHSRGSYRPPDYRIPKVYNQGAYFHPPPPHLPPHAWGPPAHHPIGSYRVESHSRQSSTKQHSKDGGVRAFPGVPYIKH